MALSTRRRRYLSGGGQSSFRRAIAAGGMALATVAAAVAALLALDLPADALSYAMAAVAVCFLTVPAAGALILRASAPSRVGWVFLASGCSFTIACACFVATRAAFILGDSGVPHPYLIAFVGAVAWVPGVPVTAIFGTLLFPDGRLPGRGWRPVAWLAAGVLLIGFICAGFAPTLLDYPTLANPVALPGVLGQATNWLYGAIALVGPLCVAAAVAMWGRARREPSPRHARALRLMALGALLVAGSFAACIVISLASGFDAWITVGEASAAAFLAVAALVGILHYGLYDVRVAVSRGLAYGLLSAVAAAVYLALAAALSGVAGEHHLLATVLAVLAVLPLRQPVQRRINRLVYGLRGEPAEALSRLGLQLEAAALSKDMLSAAARTVAETLRLPYVAIDVAGAQLGAYGEPGLGAAENLPLVVGGESIGRLRLETRHDFGPADRRLLDDLARSVAIAAQAVCLSDALQGARMRLLTAREEERSRLRADLHDGLGATLVGVALGIDSVVRSLPPGQGTQIEKLDRLRKETEDAVVDVRRLIYELRPPVLDDLGLAGAVREQAERLGAAVIDVPTMLPELSASVEVAAYRIAAEAMANAVRYAEGAPFELRLHVDGNLRLDVVDSGPGLPAGYRAGVGITSMRERAQELGGSCVVERRVPRGTQVRALLPLEAT
jgi:signal transduction histidine kinase